VEFIKALFQDSCHQLAQEPPTHPGPLRRS
jgi:hypothetical protein